MPDPDRKSVSASQVAALFNVSSYRTRWMLWQMFSHGLLDEQPESSRMKWGKVLQLPILEQVAREWKFEVHPNEAYVRNGLLGCTRDAVIVAPDRGPGAVEVKCVFDYDVWGSKWGGGKNVPREHELQLQTQMLVGDGNTSYNWGLIVAWVCADVFYYERVPIPELWQRIEFEALSFFRSIENNNEPDPFGATIEIPWMSTLFPVREGSVLDLSAAYEHVKTAEDVQQYKFHAQLTTSNSNAAEELKAKLLAIAKDNNEVRLPCGVRYMVRKHGKGKRVFPFIPDVPLPPPPVPESVIHAG